MSRPCVPVLVMLLALLSGPRVVHAQFTGWFTPQVGRVGGGDTAEGGASFAVSVAGFEGPGWLGAEVDVGHATRFNGVEFETSRITSAIAGLIVAPHRARWQPFGTLGAGVVRVRACDAGCARDISKTEFGVQGGLGVQVRVSRYVGVRGEVRYLRVVSDEADLPRRSAGAFDLWRGGVGLTLMWPEL